VAAVQTLAERKKREKKEEEEEIEPTPSLKMTTSPHE